MVNKKKEDTQDLQDPTLHEKVLAVMDSVQYIQKKGHNKNQDYKFAREADVKEALRNQFVKHGIVFNCEITKSKTEDLGLKTNGGKVMLFSEVDMTCTLSDGKDTIKFGSTGSGTDMGDKGIYKAMTGAIKYGLMNNFLIPTGTDPEADDGEGNKTNATRPPKKKNTQGNPNPNAMTEKELMTWWKTITAALRTATTIKQIEETLEQAQGIYTDYPDKIEKLRTYAQGFKDKLKK